MPTIFQLAWVVSDLDRSEALLRKALGVPRFLRLPGIEMKGPECRFRGRPADCAADISIGYSGDLQVELVRPVHGESIHQEFLDATGGGLHHVAFVAEDFPAEVRAWSERCGEPIQEGRLVGAGTVDFAYFDAVTADASVVEILGFDEAAREFFDSLRKEGR